MIEVEKKFKPTEEQLQALLKDAEYICEKILHDIYYDYPDFRLFKNKIYLRKRNNVFELKIKNNEELGASQEIENEEDIKKYFKTNKEVNDFIKDELIQIIDYKQNRREYKKDEFTIGVDELDFGFSCVEIELLVSDTSEIQVAREKILKLAKDYNFKTEKVTGKRKEYFRLIKPEIYKQLYGEK